MEPKYNSSKHWTEFETLDCFRNDICQLPGTLQEPIILGAHQNSNIVASINR